jgi:hypothetical protein
MILTFWADEAGFSSSGTTTLHNLREWALENPHAIRQSPFQHRLSVNVWAGVVDKYLTGPPHKRTYRRGQIHSVPRSINSFLLEDVPLDIRAMMWFQHDGAPPHFTPHVLNLLVTNYAERWIGRGVQCPDLHIPQI